MSAGQDGYSETKHVVKRFMVRGSLQSRHCYNALKPFLVRVNVINETLNLVPMREA